MPQVLQDNLAMTEQAPRTEIIHPVTTSRSMPGISKTLYQIVEKIALLRPDRRPKQFVTLPLPGLMLFGSAQCYPGIGS